MCDMNEDPDPFAFPDLPDEAVIAINDFIEEFYTRFQNHYFAQMHRYDHDRPDPDPYTSQTALPLDDPPF
ncbi:MAG: hypothetical protein ACREX4_19935 [Gammaproteobacteria bacterium]